jgi:hypothetical protein
MASGRLRQRREPNDLLLKDLVRAVGINASVGSLRRGQGDLANTEMDLIIRWALRTVSELTETTHASASMRSAAVVKELAMREPQYAHLRMVLEGRAVVSVEGGEVIGLEPTPGERRSLLDWLI